MGGGPADDPADPSRPGPAGRYLALAGHRFRVEQLLCEGLELAPGLTVLVGENGSGKSTLVELLAEACGLNPHGGSAMARLFKTRDSEPRLGAHLIAERGPYRPRWSYFLRADTMHSLYTYLEDVGLGGFHELSHGEGFLEILRRGHPACRSVDQCTSSRRR
jgi:predicted ATPase